MKILHTSDWHIGQSFHNYDRTFEHQQFLNWLVGVLSSKHVDVLLVSGDIFDISNPSAASIKMFYTFLNQAIQANPDLQIIITAGNHDSASRLEAPKPLLESSNVHIVGFVEKDIDGNIDYEKLIVPIDDASGNIEIYCLAIPYLRIGDYPTISDCANPYSDGVAALYNEAFRHAKQKINDTQTIIAMGHLHMHNAEITDLDKTERLIMGGLECIPPSAFHPNIKYVALGHIHKAQIIGGNEHIRYSGSPLPMSFSELNYKHQVIIFDIDQEISHLETIEIPISVPLQRIPSNHQPLHDVIALLSQLPKEGSISEATPYLEVRVLLEGPEPALRHKLENILVDKSVRLAKIDVKYPDAKQQVLELIEPDKLNELQPVDVFGKVYQSRYNCEVPAEMLHLFQQVTMEITQIGE